MELEPCRAPLFARGGHLQTLTAHFMPSPELKGGDERFILRLEDGDSLVLRIYDRPSEQVLVMFHGLAGSVRSDYLRRASHWASSLGLALVLVNLRGAGEGASYARGTYHSGSGADMARVLRWVGQRFPRRARIAVGFSLSGNILLNLLGGQSGDELPEAALAVNPAIDLVQGARLLGSGLNLIYDQRFVHELKGALRERVREGLLERVPEFPFFCRLSDFDEIFTSRAAGFSGAREYYEICSSKNYVHRITTPTAVLTAEDDPFVPVSAFREAPWSEQVEVRIEKTGGHVGYLHHRTTEFGGRRWLDDYLVKSVRRLSDLLAQP